MIDYQKKFKVFFIRTILIILIIPPLLFSYIKYKSDKNTNTKNITTYINNNKIFRLRGTIRDIKISQNGKVAYVVASSRGIYILSLQNPLQPKIISQFKYFKNSYDKARAIELTQDERRLFVRDSMAGVYSIDISNLSEPKLLAVYPKTKSISTFSISKEKIYISDDENLTIASIKNFDQIEVITKYAIDKKYFDSIEVKNNLLYLLSSNGIDIMDTSSPKQPKIIKTYSTLGDPQSISISKDKKVACISSGNNGVEILDIKNKTNPKAIGSFTSSGNIKNTTISKDRKKLYLSNFYNNLEIVDIEDINHIKSIKQIKDTQSHKKEFWNATLSSDEKFIYISYGTLGILIFSFE